MNVRTSGRAKHTHTRIHIHTHTCAHTCTRIGARNLHTAGVTPQNEGEGCVKGFSRA
ncbi:hypothetical protein PUN28_016217 [Cardiocondyla obscurior]|uniref:Uncharacterized protein n=1 Tax=Cardiocondyla obscurior TaxID=286306 RepID=A0AAW2EV31_9HYME